MRPVLLSLTLCCSPLWRIFWNQEFIHDSDRASGDCVYDGTCDCCSHLKGWLCTGTYRKGCGRDCSKEGRAVCHRLDSDTTVGSSAVIYFVIGRITKRLQRQAREEEEESAKEFVVHVAQGFVIDEVVSTRLFRFCRICNEREATRSGLWNKNTIHHWKQFSKYLYIQDLLLDQSKSILQREDDFRTGKYHKWIEKW